MVADHRAGLGMPRRAKVAAIATMWVAIVLSAVALRDRRIVLAVVVLLGVTGTAYILWRVPTRVSAATGAGSRGLDDPPAASRR
jgi:uncharacterized membrane protein YbaN (DUF454 family)